MKMKKLIDWIRASLGEPIIKVELQDNHIELQIKYAVQKFVSVAYANYRDAMVVDRNRTKLSLPHASNVTSVTQAGQPLEFIWSELTRDLSIIPKINLPPKDIIIQFVPDFNNIDLENTFILDNQWVREYSLAKTKLQWGEVIGKYTSNLVNDVQINYDRIISEAQAEIERLDQELRNRWVPPAPVVVG